MGSGYDAFLELDSHWFREKSSMDILLNFSLCVSHCQSLLLEYALQEGTIAIVVLCITFLVNSIFYLPIICNYCEIYYQFLTENSFFKEKTIYYLQACFKKKIYIIYIYEFGNMND